MMCTACHYRRQRWPGAICGQPGACVTIGRFQHSLLKTFKRTLKKNVWHSTIYCSIFDNILHKTPTAVRGPAAERARAASRAGGAGAPPPPAAPSHGR